MSFRDFLNEGYVINDDKGIVGKLSREVYILNHINNDFKYLHLNSNGHIFEILHNRFNDYYYRTGDNIDFLCEVIAQYNTNAKECCPVNFNDSPNLGKHTSSEALESEETLVNAGIKLIKVLLESLEKCRNCVSDNDAVVSRLDEIAECWQKEYAYLLKRIVK